MTCADAAATEQSDVSVFESMPALLKCRKPFRSHTSRTLTGLWVCKLRCNAKRRSRKLLRRLLQTQVQRSVPRKRRSHRRQQPKGVTKVQLQTTLCREIATNTDKFNANKCNGHRQRLRMVCANRPCQRAQ